MPRGRLRVNAPYTFAVGMIGPMLADFTRRFPEVQLTLDIDNRIVDVTAEEIDYLEKHGTPRSVKDLAGHILLSRESRVARWGYRTEQGENPDLDVLPGMVIPEPAVMQSVLIDRGGVGRLPDFLAASVVARGELVRLLPRLVSETVDVHVVCASRRGLTGKSRAFIEVLRDHLKKRISCVGKKLSRETTSQDSIDD
jgi:DNA-binding transcriptional LysR family regulator